MGEMGKIMFAKGQRWFGDKMDVFNIALLSKWRWRLMVGGNTLWNRLITQVWRINRLEEG